MRHQLSSLLYFLLIALPIRFTTIEIIPVISYNIDIGDAMHSTKEAANKLGLSQDHVRLLARKGVIQAKKLGHDWVVLDLDYTRKRKPKGGKK